MGEERDAAGSGTDRTRRDMLGILKQDENLVMALMEAASQAILATEQSGHIVIANRRAENLVRFRVRPAENMEYPGMASLAPESTPAAHPGAPA